MRRQHFSTFLPVADLHMFSYAFPPLVHCRHRQAAIVTARVETPDPAGRSRAPVKRLSGGGSRTGHRPTEGQARSGGLGHYADANGNDSVVLSIRRFDGSAHAIAVHRCTRGSLAGQATSAMRALLWRLCATFLVLNRRPFRVFLHGIAVKVKRAAASEPDKRAGSELRGFNRCGNLGRLGTRSYSESTFGDLSEFSDTGRSPSSA